MKSPENISPQSREFYEAYFGNLADSRRVMAADVGSVATRRAIRRMMTARSGRLLEIGVGLGLFLEEAPEFSRLGLDLAFASLRAARPFIPAIPLVNGDAARLPFAPGSLDVVVTSHVLEHIEDDQSVVREAHRVLKPGGELIVMVPAHMSGRVPRAEVEQMGHVRTYTRERFETLFSGLFVIEDIYYAHLLHNIVWAPVKKFLRYPNAAIKLVRRDTRYFYDRCFYTRCVAPFFLTILDPLDRRIGREGSVLARLLGVMEKNRNICLRARKGAPA